MTTTVDTDLMEQIVEELAKVNIITEPDPHTIQEQLITLLKHTDDETLKKKAVERIIALRRSYQRQSDEYAKQEEDLKAQKKVYATLSDQIDEAFVEYFETEGIDTVTTPSGSVTVHVSGGKEPVEIDNTIKPADAPPAWTSTKTTVSFNKAKLYTWLKEGRFPHSWARLGSKKKSVKYS